MFLPVLVSHGKFEKNISLLKLNFQNTQDRKLRFLFCTHTLFQKCVLVHEKKFPQEAQTLLCLTTFKVKL